MTLPIVKPEDLVLSANEARQVLQFFFGESAVPSPGGITDADRCFAQALLTEAVRASQAIGWFQSLWKSSVMPTSIGSVLRKMATWKAVRDYLSAKFTEKDIIEIEIYSMARSTIAWNSRIVWTIRLQNSEAVLY
jgi:hypothetical protein